MPWYETDAALIAVVVLFGIAAFSLLMYNDWKEQHAKATPTQAEPTATSAGNPAAQYAAAHNRSNNPFRRLTAKWIV